MVEKVIKIVKEASNIMLKEDFTSQVKGTVSNIVTSNDIKVQKFLHEKLAKLLPNSGFLGEEDLNTVQGEYYWIIDPIDGTTNYSRNMNLSGISVALAKNKEVVLGVVYNPFTKEVFHAVKNKGAFLNGKKISVSNASFEKSLFCTAASVYKKEFGQICFDIIQDVYYQSNDIRRLGSCALELCYLAAGKCDLYFEIRVFPWDYAAAGLILQEAGGVLCTHPHKKLLYDQPVTLVGANTQENYEKLEKIVARHIEEEIDLT